MSEYLQYFIHYNGCLVSTYITIIEDPKGIWTLAPKLNIDVLQETFHDIFLLGGGDIYFI